ncbi:WecB/TagA/CpsF family glycosyltransferase [Lentibacillus sp. Marseille-P4043]|uniref:WecB/TagA/CpsF family glycosyltransferase n=1 Tax=Lentibacillus sp. Marseille-P4043 TaxID=2040293 RepID=UPI000D0B788E|nr:WecB/TagA/CpsF family glycosyltransferase [Lentibacillus sp. Marseille-P4043]
MSNEAKVNNFVSIMGIPFVNITKEKLLQNHLFPRLIEKEKCYIVTANPEMVMRTTEDASYKKQVNAADFIVPDGAGIVIASKFMKQPIQERIPGFELMVDLLEFANDKGLSCFFLGAQEQVNEKMIDEIEKRYPHLRIAGNHHGYFSIDDPAVVEQVKASEPDLVFAALGSPRQEQWITAHFTQFEKGLFMGVGGSFDVLAGEVKRAPDSWIRLNLEWLYRLLKQPFRWKRILKSLKFMVLIMLGKR